MDEMTVERLVGEVYFRTEWKFVGLEKDASWWRHGIYDSPEEAKAVVRREVSQADGSIAVGRVMCHSARLDGRGFVIGCDVKEVFRATRKAARKAAHNENGGAR